MKLPLRSRLRARPLRFAAIAALGVAVAVLAAWMPARLDVTAGPTPPELAGVYRVEPISRGNPTATLTYLRLSPKGEARLESVRVRDDGRKLSAKASTAAVSGRWYVKRQRGMAALVRPAQLCTRMGKRPATCSRVDRDATTGDMAVSGLSLGGRARRQHLVKLRTEALAP